MKLRDYQTDSVQKLRESIRKGNRRLLLVAPTGSGKTVIAAEIMQRATEKGKHVLFLAHLRELIIQCADKLSQFGVPRGILMAGMRMNPAFVQVASVQTLWSRCKKGGRPWPRGDILVIDEAHRVSHQGMYGDILDAYPGAVVLGMTATPMRSDGYGLGNKFDDLVVSETVAGLTEQGYLVPVRYFAPSLPDLKGLKVQAGDYVKGELERRMDKPKLVGDIVDNWLRLAPERSTMVFASGVRHSMHIRDRFQSEGIKAEHVDGNTPHDERRMIIEQTRTGEVKILTSCGVFLEGFDMPILSCGILARPTKSFGLFIQMAGRLLRPCEGKKETLLIDHAGAVYSHGFIDQEIDWELTDEKIKDKITKKRLKEPMEIRCEKCSAVYKSLASCPNCGHSPEKKGKMIAFRPGDLVEVSKNGAKKYSMEDKARWWAGLEWYRLVKGFAPGWTGHTYRDKFGVWPKDVKGEPKQPGKEVMGYITHKNIRYAKRRR